MGFLSKLGGYVGRGAAALATGGASEAYRAATGKVDPYTAYQQRLGTAVGSKAGSAIGEGGNTANPYDTESPEEKAARMRAQGDVQVSRDFRNQLAGQTAGPRTAVQVSAPTPVQGARVGAVAPISAGAPVVAGQVASTFDPAMANQTRDQQAAYLARLQGVENGTAPSVAVDAMRQASARDVAQSYALAGSKGGYGGYAIRGAQRAGAQAGQQLVGQVGQERAAEAATAREQEGGMLTGMRGQDLATAQTGAQLGLQAGIANQGANLGAAEANQGAGLEAARANQAADLQRSLTQAGFDQQTLMHMSDQELATKLANAGFKVTQEQIDDLRQHNLTQSQLEANGQTIGASQSEANRQLQIKQLRAQMAMAIQQNDQKKQDATLAMLAQLGAAYATGGASAAGGAALGGGGGGDMSYINATNDPNSNLE